MNEHFVPPTSKASAFITSSLNILKTINYTFPEQWSAGQYRDYVIENDCMLFYTAQIKSNGRIVNSDNLFEISAVLSGSIEMPIDKINTVTNGSDMISGCVACRAGTTIRVKNNSSSVIPASTSTEQSFYTLRECGPISSSETFDGLISGSCSVKRTITYEFPDAWSAGHTESYTVTNDCLLFYQIQVNTDGKIVNDDNKFVVAVTIGGVDVPIDSVNIVANGSNIKSGCVLCKAGSVIKLKNDSQMQIPASTSQMKSFYTIREIA